ncbi:MAG: hypothetical protein IPK13_09285 [Deltaproteobacteria bacterium]|nr:hypothetical protein [Deltaproteobacteria bacterium]
MFKSRQVATGDGRVVSFRVASRRFASLKRHFPEVHDYVFRNLSQTEGPEVILSVSTFLRRIADLTRSTSGLGDEGKRAKMLLEQRGLKSSVVRIAQDLLERVGTIESEEASTSPEALEVEIQRAEQALWTWYLEWAQIARVAITRRSLLRQLGFLAARGSRAESFEGFDDDSAVVDDDSAAPDALDDEPDGLSGLGTLDRVNAAGSASAGGSASSSAPA